MKLGKIRGIARKGDLELVPIIYITEPGILFPTEGIPAEVSLDTGNYIFKVLQRTTTPGELLGHLWHAAS